MDLKYVLGKQFDQSCAFDRDCALVRGFNRAYYILKLRNFFVVWGETLGEHLAFCRFLLHDSGSEDDLHKYSHDKRGLGCLARS